MRGTVIAEGNYGQTEGVFLCSLSFARAKKVRRQPGATGTTAIDCKALSLSAALLYKTREVRKQTASALSTKRSKANPGVAPPVVALLFLCAQNE